jgi:hypothetical protein
MLRAQERTQRVRAGCSNPEQARALVDGPEIDQIVDTMRDAGVDISVSAF